jgi:hypothetical protein
MTSNSLRSQIILATLFCGFWAALAARPAQAADPVSLESLLLEMVDRDRLARLPQPAFTCRQFSSYDRDTVAPDQPGWFANWDRSQFVRVEENAGRREWVLMDADGPGAVVRFWATWHGPGGGPFSNGTLRFYLDNDPEPAIQGPMADLISGGALVPPPLSDSVSPDSPYERRGHNLYLPVPYARHCKITYESEAMKDIGGKQGEALYYQINYRTYAPGTAVESFAKDRLAALKPLVAQVGKRLLESGIAPDSGTDLVSETGTLDPGQRETVVLPGPAAIGRLMLRIAAENLPQALRSTVLEIEFDGHRTVWCPVGDFFGTGYQLNAHRTWYTQVAADGTMQCFWVMPFQRNCRLTLHNLGTQPVEIQEARVTSGPWTWDDRSLLFHAAWRQYTKLDTGPDKNQTGDGAFDANYVQVQGQGQFVGDTLTLFNGTAAWWGEGDEKIYVDGERLPSHIGTGTEDYYGYAWCRPEFFQAPFHAQPCGDGNLASGFSVNSRYRGLDAIPFTGSFRFDMEMWHWRNTVINYAPATFWYARPGATWNVEPDPNTAAAPVAMKRSDVVDVLVVPGAIEGESLKVAERTGGTTEIQDIDLFRWSDDKQLWWIDGKPGDRLVLEFPVTEAGTYRVLANLTKARDYGQFRFQVNGQATDKTFDRFHPRVAHDLVELGTFPLGAGLNRLVVEIVGANPQAVKRHMFGLDYLKLEPAE